MQLGDYDTGVANSHAAIIGNLINATDSVQKPFLLGFRRPARRSLI
jgi:hypothetical protein